MLGLLEYYFTNKLTNIYFIQVERCTRWFDRLTNLSQGRHHKKGGSANAEPLLAIFFRSLRLVRRALQPIQ